jgi:hypothetical protein
MVALVTDLYIEQGASFHMNFQWCEEPPDPEGAPDVPGDPYDLTGGTARMQFRKKQHDPVLAEATTANGKITLGLDPDGNVDLTTGWFDVLLSDEDTDVFDVKKGLYDFEFVDSTGFVYRLLQGAFEVSPNITQVPAEDPIVVDE